MQRNPLTKLSAYHGQNRRRRAGFSLIEILSAVAILIIIVGIMAAIFTESDRAWNLATGRAMNNTDGRAALGIIAHDLQYAVTYSNYNWSLNIFTNRTPPELWGPTNLIITFHLTNDIVSFGFTNSELAFVSLQTDCVEAPRAAREIWYYVKRTNMLDPLGRTYTNMFQLVRGAVDEAIWNPGGSNWINHAYHTNYWWYTRRPGGASYAVVADNLVGFKVVAGPPVRRRIGAEWKLVMLENYDSMDYSNQLPEYVDIYLELLNERDALQAAKMWSDSNFAAQTNTAAFIERNAKRYATRVYFHNRQGYRPR